MNLTRVHQEILSMRFGELYQKQQEKQFTIEEAAEMLGVSERTFRRYAQKYDGQSVEGLVDGEFGRPSDSLTECQGDIWPLFVL